MRDYFKDKVVCITGSSKGIGKETATLLGSYGAKICLNGRNGEALLKTHDELTEKGIDCIAVAGDVSLIEDCKRIIDTAIEKYGKLDILINNAGISTRGKFAEIKAETWKKVIGINTLGCIYPTTFALPHLLQSKGSVLFISSLGGKVGLPGHSNYSVSKMGLTSLVKALQIEYSKKELHAGIVYVGFTENEAEKKILTATGEYVPLKARGNVKAAKRNSVAHAIAKVLRNRKKAVTLTVLGKFQSVALRLCPAIVTVFLKRSYKDYEEMYK